MDINTLKRPIAREKGRKVALIDACRIDPLWNAAIIVYKPRLVDIPMMFSTKRDSSPTWTKIRSILPLPEHFTRWQVQGL